ncbi:MAG: hypothetical protein A2Z77_00215 [Chloroflexi bacterium RBG_13_51_36]|nr:MAG: hypothetical protein A2Z77_00215 [Chloroflexi bacterium RBG_13_51_36]
MAFFGLRLPGVSLVDQIAATMTFLVAQAHLVRVPFGKARAAPALQVSKSVSPTTILFADFSTQLQSYRPRYSIHVISSIFRLFLTCIIVNTPWPQPYYTMTTSES